MFVIHDGAMLVSHVGMQREFRDLLLPLWIPFHDGMINLLRFMFLKLHVECTM